MRGGRVEPVLCLNMGTGTLDEALAWVEYCNGTGDTYWANRRRANGHAGPYRVRYWGLGNEMYGDWQIGQRAAADYVTTARQWAKAIRFLDPGVSLVSCGQSGVNDWDRVVIDGLARYVDLHSIHLYTGSDDYWSNVLAPHFAERALSRGRGPDRAGPVRAADQPRDRRGLRRVERLVPHRRRAAGGAVHPGRRAGRGDLPQRVRAPERGACGWPTWPSWST